ncbi:methyltransferase domain-containing protein [Embleya hyalina]|uniref:Protein-L-isoaspartate O-methyltransferase n=1 Tax=Embleya hyalina TaxID=516124 RepID=A0A401Z1S6_9ACTN|nr:methyltransferase domain-containing protein [Embleya hyalina]GCE00726.1 protein-L-isoaspartate O-methyltransferase [Embleya hyalina]
MKVLDDQALIAARVRLVERIAAGDVVLSSRIAEAFLNVPRHVFTPVFYRREYGDRFVPWRADDTGDADGAWWDAVYSGESLITEVDGVHAEHAPPEGVFGAPTSSSTAPDLMADMLDALDPTPGARTLEIGTGSGYNTALLSRLVGADNVTTVDHTPHLVATARQRLKVAGFTPDVVPADGTAGWAPNAPYDRLIATASVPRVPDTWIEQCAPGAVLVVPLKGTLAGGSIAWLKKLPDGTAAGRLMHTPAAFMPLLPRTDVTEKGPRFAHRETGHAADRTRTSPLTPRVLDDWTFSFFAQLHLDPHTTRTFTHIDGRHSTTLRTPNDRTTVTDTDDGTEVAWVGGRDLWAPMEQAHRLWLELNRPRREWFTVEVVSTGQYVSLETPAGDAYTWTL